MSQPISFAEAKEYFPELMALLEKRVERLTPFKNTKKCVQLYGVDWDDVPTTKPPRIAWLMKVAVEFHSDKSVHVLVVDSSLKPVSISEIDKQNIKEDKDYT